VKRKLSARSTGTFLGENEEMPVSISVIVITKNRPVKLEACLRSIASSSYPYEELIVVDSSNKPISKQNEKLTRDLGGKYCYENIKRQAAARNKGINLSSGDIVVFADDDFIVDKDWIKNLVVNYRDHEVACCTGNIVSYRDDESSRLRESFGSFDRGNKRSVFTKKDFSILKLIKLVTFIGNKSLGEKTPLPFALGGGFLSFARWIFEEVGYFDNSLGRGEFSTGEEVDMVYRVAKSKYKCVFEPTAIVYHDHPRTIEDVIKLAYTYGTYQWTSYRKFRYDLYMWLCFVGSLFLSVSTLIKAILKSDRELRRVMVAHLKGFFHGFRRV